MIKYNNVQTISGIDRIVGTFEEIFSGILSIFGSGGGGAWNGNIRPSDIANLFRSMFRRSAARPAGRRMIDAAKNAEENISDKKNTAAEDTKQSADKMKGGKQSSRDKDYGIKDKDFWQWWHRSPDGKKGHGNEDKSSKEEANEIYNFWKEIGSPKQKK